MNNIEQKFCEAIEIIVERAVKQANYDKTIQATIVECVDETTGKFLVKYQDSTFYAYSNNLDSVYVKGTSVYVLIPRNNMEADKTILGTTKKLGINYIPTIEEDEAYQIIGNNCISSTKFFGLCSYKKEKQVKILYSKEYSEDENLIDLNITAVNEYIKNQNTIICGATIKTELATEQQFRGNYGVIFALNFIDNADNSIITRYYTIDVDKMRGNPYKILYDTRQYAIFNIDGENFVDVDSISIFCYGFPNSKPDEECIDDIFIKDFELFGAEKLKDDDLNNYSLTFYTPQGIYFDKTSLLSDTRIIEAQVRIKGKVVNNSDNKISFYWFIEHAGITSDSTYYNKNGGQGWKCLNNYNIVKKANESDPEVVEWIPASNKWIVSKNDIIAKEVKYKCVAIYEGIAISKTIIIKNLASDYDISIISSEGTKFYFDRGRPTLTCLVNEKEEDSYSYSWAVINNTGNFESIENTVNENNDFSIAYYNYYKLASDIEKELLPYEPNKEKLIQYKNELDKYNSVTRVNGNKIFNLNISFITEFSTYKCTVYHGNLYLGTASIVLVNSLVAEGVYSIVINNGSYVYKYDENGVSPASSAINSPINIQALSFTVYDNLGNVIDDDIIRHSEIKWIVPIANTMIEIPNSYTEYEEDLDRGIRIYKNLMTLAYNIANRYDITKTNNDIKITVNYKNISLSTKTDLVFTKEGDSGTNGTEFFCRIVPNIIPGRETPFRPLLTELSNGNWFLNYDLQQANRFFKVQLWHNENKILDSVSSATSAEGKEVNIKWSILKNKYSGSIFDSSSLSIDENTGVLTYNGYRSDSPANIVKVELEYDGVIYYATIPLITVKIYNDDYRVSLKDNTGFINAIYSSDGKRPRYNNVNPFELKVTQKIGVYDEDVSLKTSDTYAVSYSWSYLGRIYENSWIDDVNLADRLSNTLANQKSVKPLDDYDGQCVTNAIECIISKSNIPIARIHIPVHLMLNRYGNSAINGWDGNSVNIDSDGGFILAPQVGAGIKENDNSFTGVVIGKVKETNQIGYDIGLLGYSKGMRSIFLDAQTGKATFGVNGKGQIVIDPTSNRAQIYSGNYSTSEKTGLMIDLTTPEIKYGSGNFVVNKDGHLTAKGGGTIAGWNISDDGLYIGKTNSSDNSRTGAFLGADGTVNIGNSEKYFKFVNGQLEVKGTLKADEGNIGNWQIKNGRIVGNSNSYLEAGIITGSTVRGGEIIGTTIQGGTNIHFNARPGYVSIGDFMVDDSYGRHIFQSSDECTGMSTGDINRGEWYLWAGYGLSSYDEAMFLVNTGQVRVGGDLFLKGRNIIDIINELIRQSGGGGCPRQGSGCSGNSSCGCDSQSGCDGDCNSDELECDIQ